MYTIWIRKIENDLQDKFIAIWNCEEYQQYKVRKAMSSFYSLYDGVLYRIEMKKDSYFLKDGIISNNPFI